ncbi:hypothetical protein B0H14DRAFT_3606983 [Mycena olivaceomarginata]|nr:hypothetical protein B0H14DRAFT_3606983 [Mycena olivaceomarginata]
MAPPKQRCLQSPKHHESEQRENGDIAIKYTYERKDSANARPAGMHRRTSAGRKMILWESDGWVTEEDCNIGCILLRRRREKKEGKKQPRKLYVQTPEVSKGINDGGFAACSQGGRSRWESQNSTLEIKSQSFTQTTMDTPPFPLEIFEVVTIAHPDTGPRLLRACHRAYLVGLGFKAVCGKPNYRLSARQWRWGPRTWISGGLAYNAVIQTTSGCTRRNSLPESVREKLSTMKTAVHHTPHPTMGLACAVVKCGGIDGKSAGPGWVEERGLYI